MAFGVVLPLRAASASSFSGLFRQLRRLGDLRGNRMLERKREQVAHLRQQFAGAGSRASTGGGGGFFHCSLPRLPQRVGRRVRIGALAALTRRNQALQAVMQRFGVAAGTGKKMPSASRFFAGSDSGPVRVPSCAAGC